MALKKNHKDWLIKRGITESILNDFDISSAYNRIVIPVTDLNGIVLFNKYRRDPEESEGSKYTYDIGATIKLFNIKILDSSKKIIICEGELDVLCLQSHGYNAVTSTGGAQSFQKDWVPFFKDIEIFICLDNDSSGQLGTIKISDMFPEAKVVPLPQETGVKDVTDFFRIHSNKEFDALLRVAYVPEHAQMPAAYERPRPVRRKTGDRIEQAKDIPIETFLKFNSVGKASCPFHTDNTPSLQRYKNNTWFCFSCRAGRDTIDFIMKRYNLTFNEAIDFLLK